MAVNTLTMQGSNNLISASLRSVCVEVEKLTCKGNTFQSYTAGLLASPVIVVTEALNAVVGVLQVIWGVVGGVGIGVTNRSWSKFIDFASGNINNGLKTVSEGILKVGIYSCITFGVYGAIASFIAAICAIMLIV